MATTIGSAPAPVESTYEIKSREDAETALALKKSYSLQIEEQKLKSYKVELIRSKINRFIKGLEQKVAAIDSELRIWAENNRAKEFGESRTLNLLNGVLEFKWGPPAIRILCDWTEKMVIAALRRRRGFKEFVRVKHEIDRQQLGRAIGDGNLTAKDLARVGLESKSEEFFTAKPQ